MLFKKFFTRSKGKENEKYEGELKEEIGKKMANKKNILHSIETYFIKKIGTHPFTNV